MRRDEKEYVAAVSLGRGVSDWHCGQLFVACGWLLLTPEQESAWVSLLRLPARGTSQCACVSSCVCPTTAAEPTAPAPAPCLLLTTSVPGPLLGVRGHGARTVSEGPLCSGTRSSTASRCARTRKQTGDGACGLREVRPARPRVVDPPTHALLVAGIETMAHSVYCPPAPYTPGRIQWVAGGCMRPFRRRAQWAAARRRRQRRAR